MVALGVPAEVAALREGIRQALDMKDADGRKVGDCQHGVYAFYDYDGEPIYVGQTSEKLRVRIRRHLTNHRTDAVAMNVLDPFEVADIEMWPLWSISAGQAVELLNRVEYTVFEDLLIKSRFHAILNEKDMPEARHVELPVSYRTRIVPADLWAARKHPDVRIARRANTIASLAKVISEREVSPGLRRTLLTQARRLEHLAETRFADFNPDDLAADGADLNETD